MSKRYGNAALEHAHSKMLSTKQHPNAVFMRFPASSLPAKGYSMIGSLPGSLVLNIPQ